jgi:hypothetical protein
MHIHCWKGSLIKPTLTMILTMYVWNMSLRKSKFAVTITMYVCKVCLIKPTFAKCLHYVCLKDVLHKINICNDPNYVCLGDILDRINACNCPNYVFLKDVRDKSKVSNEPDYVLLNDILQQYILRLITNIGDPATTHRQGHYKHWLHQGHPSIKTLRVVTHLELIKDILQTYIARVITNIDFIRDILQRYILAMIANLDLIKDILQTKTTVSWNVNILLYAVEAREQRSMNSSLATTYVLLLCSSAYLYRESVHITCMTFDLPFSWSTTPNDRNNKPLYKLL